MGKHAVTSPVLETVALACERDWRLLFERLDLRLNGGEMLQVSGPNGSGKTSLLRLLAGLMQPTTGEVRLNGKALSKQRGELARNLLWIGHAAGIKGLLTAEENLAWLCALHQPAARATIWRALEAVGLRGFEDVPCHTLSAGQQRRVALARLYLEAPPLWILDEPFTALDKQGVAQLEQHLARHCEQGGLVVLTTHHTLAVKPAAYRDLDLGALMVSEHAA
ncbi:cytochrome c biogenesis heme-transporting ATPase CcmA [Pseudomonas cavernae]|uniref:Cytochrome c biogenesis heme-transporting ATPase CcmA n=1 Tax=Pseudomonas cavernae TaxID=2320867 RepID=A0A385Z4C1_9PSED|nr:cytochrome c biogenesis heme-transporting ATPase CcmA [Pseudomonas cavernae]AYC32558.1 cytochrome c biogenesis heme-transporting ATPase CcmA [Pseudomonas cavernae]